MCTGLLLWVILIPGAVTTYATFPGANGKIAFSSSRDGNQEIYVMNPDGSEQTNLTNNPALDSASNWSADGSKTAFFSDRDGNYEVSSYPYDIYTMNADGSGPIRLTTDLADSFPSWSPDGSKIAFTSTRDDNPEIYVMNADGTGQMRLTNNVVEDNYPAWSPDGSKIAFTSARDGNYEIYVMNADGSGQTNLTNTTGAGESTPNWSPDGTKIVFFSNRDDNNEIYVMNADGSGQTRLTNNTIGDYYPVWSPDGTKIAFTSDRDGNEEIYVMNTDGSGQTRLTNNPEGNRGADWQPLPSHNNFSGFFQPVDNLPTLNVVRAGQAIPVKFSLNGDQGVNIFATDYPRSQNIQCDSTVATDGIEETITAGSSSLSYNPSSDTYTYVWKTDKTWTDSCRQLVVKFSDGTYHRANFKFK